MQVTQFINSNIKTGVKNHFVILDNGKQIFQSYNSKIAEYDEANKTLTIYPEWDYSNTTRKHFYNWLCQTLHYGIGAIKQAEVLKAITDGYICTPFGKIEVAEG